MNRVLIFAGTTEGRTLSEYLSENRIEHTVCVATEYGSKSLTENEYLKIHAGRLDEKGVAEYTENACPTCGSCSGMYTANSMNCLTEAIGMALRGNGTVPAVYSARLRLAKHTGMKIMELVEKNIRPRDIMTKAAFHNAETIDMALGCSTNTMLHLPAIAHECGIELSFDMANEISDHTPNLCHLAPAGNTYMEDLERAGGVYAVMAELAKKADNQ